VHDFPSIFIGWQSAATAGHCVTMLGVFSFYSALFESSIEKKITTYTYNLVPRFTKKHLKWNAKIIKLKSFKKSVLSLPKKNVRVKFIKKVARRRHF
jgi:hypothetical protein